MAGGIVLCVVLGKGACKAFSTQEVRIATPLQDAAAELLEAIVCKEPLTALPPTLDALLGATTSLLAAGRGFPSLARFTHVLHRCFL